MENQVVAEAEKPHMFYRTGRGNAFQRAKQYKGY